jgi:choline dehydrogenase
MYDDFIKSRANPIYHGSSSCRMGVAGEAPVDPVTLQVRGTSNLHVFDASAFPNVPSTHPQSLVFAGAEKVAQQLLRKAE